MSQGSKVTYKMQTVVISLEKNLIPLILLDLAAELFFFHIENESCIHVCCWILHTANTHGLASIHVRAKHMQILIAQK
jgi:hypothetical protein